METFTPTNQEDDGALVVFGRVAPFQPQLGSIVEGIFEAHLVASTSLPIFPQQTIMSLLPPTRATLLNLTGIVMADGAFATLRTNSRDDSSRYWQLYVDNNDVLRFLRNAGGAFDMWFMDVPAGVPEFYSTNASARIGNSTNRIGTVFTSALDASGTITGIDAGDVGAQPADSDLTIIAGLTPTNGNLITGNGSAWTSAPLDADLVTIAGLTPTNGKLLGG